MRSVVLSAMVCALGVGTLGAQSARQGILSLDEGRIFYEVVGTRTPVVVVHGGPGLDSRYLRPGLDVLSSVASLIYYDQRGTGRSEVPLDTKTINLHAFVEDIEGLRVALGHERITVLGHSFGTVLALAYALEHPQRTRALILMNPAPGAEWSARAGARLRAQRSAADSTEMAELAATEAFQAREAEAMSRYYRLAYRAIMRDPARIDQVNLDLTGRTARNGPEIGPLLGPSMASLDWWGRLSEVEAPTLVLHGRFDATPTAMAQAMVEALPRGRLVVLDTGHFPYVEDPAGLLSEVTTFLATLER